MTNFGIKTAPFNGSRLAQLPWGFNYDPEQFRILDTIKDPAGAILHVRDTSNPQLTENRKVSENRNVEWQAVQVPTTVT